MYQTDQDLDDNGTNQKLILITVFPPQAQIVTHNQLGML